MVFFNEFINELFWIIFINVCSIFNWVCGLFRLSIKINFVLIFCFGLFIWLKVIGVLLIIMVINFLLIVFVLVCGIVIFWCFSCKLVGKVDFCLIIFGKNWLVINLFFCVFVLIVVNNFFDVLKEVCRKISWFFK